MNIEIERKFLMADDSWRAEAGEGVHYAQGYLNKKGNTVRVRVTENYYTCTDEILAGLGKMYVADDRFKKNIDKYADGTAEFAAEAIAVYCRKASSWHSN